MDGKKVTGVILAAAGAFAASSLWYSPLLFGKQFIALSGAAAAGGAGPDGPKFAAEILRNLLLAVVVGQLLAGARPKKLSGALGLAGLLWLGFPVTLLSGSVLWQNVATEVALIHSGDWLLKLLVMTLIPCLVNRSTEIQKRRTIAPSVAQSN